MTLSRPWFSAVAIWALLAGPGSAVIVGGANGDGLGNASNSGLQAYLSSQSQAAFPYWDNLLRVSNSSGVYLGRNASTGRGWVLCATHVNPAPTSITVAGQAYVVRDRQVLQHTDGSGTYDTDICLYMIGGEPGDPALPSLPAVPVLAGDVQVGDPMLLTGRGRRYQTPEDVTPPYLWDGLFDEPNQITRQMRWGSNNVGIWSAVAPDTLFELTEGSPTTTKLTISFACVFDDPAAGGTAYEGQIAFLDSGGGVFIERNGAWYLAGTNYTVDDGPDADSFYNPAGYGDFSIMTHLPSYRDQFVSVTGLGDPAEAVAAHSVVSPATALITADGTSTQVITVQARDVHDHNLTIGGATVVITRSSGTGTIGSVTDHGGGTYTATVTAPTTAGAGTFEATLGGVAVGTAVGAASAVITYRSRFDAWIAGYSGLGGLTGFADDPNHDGVGNGLAWILGGTPNGNSRSVLPAASSDGSNNLTLEFKRAKASVGEATLAVQYGPTLDAWSGSVAVPATGTCGPDGNNNTVTVSALDAFFDQITVLIGSSNAAGGSLFARVGASQP